MSDIPSNEEELYHYFAWYEETHPKDRRELNPKYSNNIMPSNPSPLPIQEEDEDDDDDCEHVTPDQRYREKLLRERLGELGKKSRKRFKEENR